MKCLYASGLFHAYFISSLQLKYFHSFFRKQNFIAIHISLFPHKCQSYGLFVLIINKRLFLFFFYNHLKVEKSTKKRYKHAYTHTRKVHAMSLKKKKKGKK